MDDNALRGAATVKFTDGFEDQDRHVYDRALRKSDNEAYDRLLQIAGVDWLNAEFLTAGTASPRRSSSARTPG